MKKTLALLLTVALIISSAFATMPVFATSENVTPTNATPLTGYSINYPFYQVVTAKAVTPEATEKFVIADGIGITSKTVEAYSEANVKNSKVLAQALYNSAASQGYQLPESFATDGSFIVYVKTNAANKMYFLFTSTYTAANYTTSGEIKANAGYEVAAVGADVWTAATADENGYICFDGAFEGFVKIPAASTKSVDNVTMTFKAIGSIGARFEGIGGDYGEINMGPFFVTTDDSASAKINVPDEFKPEPIEAAPLTGYSISYPFYQVVTAQATMPKTTKKFVIADGIKITSKTAEAYSETNVKNSKVLAQGVYNSAAIQGYQLPENFANDGSFIVYVKTSAANKMYFLFTSTYAANYTTSGEVKANADYEFTAVGDYVWTDAKADENGFICFDGAFEGFVKIPAASTKSVDNVTMTFKAIGGIGARFEGIGGEYGEIDMGPFFVTTDDSKSVKINVPGEFKPAPINAIPLVDYTIGNPFYSVIGAQATVPEATAGFVTANGINITPKTEAGYSNTTVTGSQVLAQVVYNTSSASKGYQLPADFAAKGSFIMYVKTNSANKMHIQLTTTYGAANYQTVAQTTANADFEYVAIDGKEWTSAKTDANGVMAFSKAFEGYVKIPVTSLKSLDNLTMNFNYLGFIGIRFEGVGATYGDIVAGPFFVTTDDSSSITINVADEYKPQPLDIKSFDFSEVRSSGYNYSVDKIEGTNNYKLYIDESILSDTSVKYPSEDKKWSYVENEDGQVASGGSTPLVMTPTVKTYMKDAQGMVFYVKFSKANKFAPCLIFDDAKSFMLKPNSTVYVLENGTDAWAEKTVEIGHGENTVIYGMVSFDEAFEGYIKVPFSSFNNDSNKKLSFTGDDMSALTSIALRFKGIGDDTMYGKEVVVGVSGYYTEDTPKASIGNIAAPEYENGDVNYDWKVDSGDLVAVRKSIIGYKGYTGYAVTVVDLVKVKKILAK